MQSVRTKAHAHSIFYNPKLKLGVIENISVLDGLLNNITTFASTLHTHEGFHTCEGTSHSRRLFTLERKLHTCENGTHLRGHCIHMRTLHTCEDTAHLRTHCTLANTLHTYKDITHNPKLQLGVMALTIDRGL